MADEIGYKRPIDLLASPALEMRYGLGGTHATVVPFMNFRMLGVLVIPALWANMFTHLEKGVLKRLNVSSLAFLCTVATAAPHWLWYGEKNGLNALIIYSLLGVMYRISLAIGPLSTPVLKNTLWSKRPLRNPRLIPRVR